MSPVCGIFVFTEQDIDWVNDAYDSDYVEDMMTTMMSVPRPDQLHADDSSSVGVPAIVTDHPPHTGAVGGPHVSLVGRAASDLARTRMRTMRIR